MFLTYSSIFPTVIFLSCSCGRALTGKTRISGVANRWTVSLRLPLPGKRGRTPTCSTRRNPRPSVLPSTPRNPITSRESRPGYLAATMCTNARRSAPDTCRRSWTTSTESIPTLAEMRHSISISTSVLDRSISTTSNNRGATSPKEETVVLKASPKRVVLPSRR